MKYTKVIGVFLALCYGGVTYSGHCATNAWTFKNNCTNNVNAWWYGWGAGWKQVLNIAPGQTITSSQMYAAYGFSDYSANGTWWSDSNGGAPKESGWQGWYNACGDPSQTTTNCATVSVINLDSVPRYFALRSNSVYVATQMLSSGQEWRAVICGTNGWFSLDMVRLFENGAEDGPSYTGYYTTNSAPPTSGGEHAVAASGGSSYYGGNTTNIYWSTNVDMSGYSALYDAVTKAANRAHDDAVMLSNRLAGLAGAGTVVSNYVGLSNYVTVNVTNVGTGFTNPWATLTNTGSSEFTTISNLIQNASNVANGILGSSGFSAAANTMAGALGGMASMEGGSAEGIAIPVGTYEFLMNPVGSDAWGSVWWAMKELMRWVLCAWYLIWVLRDSYDVVNTMGSAQQLRLPTINAEVFGIGGNWGAALLPVIMAGLLVAFGVGLGMVATIITDSVPITAVFKTDPFSGASGAVATGVSWLKMAFPFDTLFSLAGAYATWRLTMTGAAATIVVTIRMIVG